ncbi:hypothetical protein RHGRI_019913 [Rhododendron griersonianum]|uniref:Secreted protein n=1 Tax=Rhododendron griersonianum TaxID=479676 RepID=A0AAV6JHB1_9ERIC|nr:hypothetical protein RHGRI_019913 [Rhododendron griersonianum]
MVIVLILQTLPIPTLIILRTHNKTVVIVILIKIHQRLRIKPLVEPTVVKPHHVVIILLLLPTIVERVQIRPVVDLPPVVEPVEVRLVLLKRTRRGHRTKPVIKPVEIRLVLFENRTGRVKTRLVLLKNRRGVHQVAVVEPVEIGLVLLEKRRRVGRAAVEFAADPGVEIPPLLGGFLRRRVQVGAPQRVEVGFVDELRVGRRVEVAADADVEVAALLGALVVVAAPYGVVEGEVGQAEVVGVYPELVAEFPEGLLLVVLHIC